MPRVSVRPLATAALLGALVLALISIGAARAGVTTSSGSSFANPELPNLVNPALITGNENTNAIVQNTGTAPATIAMNFYTAGGIQIPAASQVYTGVPVGATRTFQQASNPGLIPPYRGVGRIESDQEINALLVRDITSFSVGKGYSIHNAFASGGNTVSLPFVANKLGNVFNTRIAIANSGDATACVTIEYAFIPGMGSVGAGGKAPVTDSGPGGQGCGTGHPIPAGGQIAFAPDAVDGAKNFPGSTLNTLMAATVTSTGAPVVVAVDAYRVPGQGRQLASYDGFLVESEGSNTDDLSTDIVMPMALKTPDGYYTQYLFSNPWDESAEVTVHYSGTANGQPFNGTVERTVPAHGTANNSVYDADSGIPVGFVGAATIESDIPIAAVLFRGKMTVANSYVYEDLYTAINGVPAEDGATEWKVPLVFRNAYKPGPLLKGYNSWVSVQVVDGSTANVTLTTVNDTTNAAPNCQQNQTYTFNTTVSGSRIFYQDRTNANETGLGAVPGCLWGGMTVTADKSVVVVANVTNDLNIGDNDGFYNGFAE